MATIKRFLSPVYFGSKEAFAYITAKESVRDGHRIYSIEIEKLESIDGKLKGGFPSTSIDSSGIISKLRSKVNGPETRNLYSKDGSVIGWFDKVQKGRVIALMTTQTGPNPA